MEAETVLVADIGGTNTRFALASHDSDEVRILARQSVPTSEIGAIEAAAWRFVGGVGAKMPGRGVFAVAAPIMGDEIDLTNSALRFSILEVSARLGLALKVVNDFEALARGAATATGEGLRRIKPGVPLGDAPRVVLGPGTGLGLALLVPASARTLVIATQGGHAAFAPLDETERAICARIAKSAPFASYEEVLSGRGLRAIYMALAEQHGWDDAPSPEEITHRGLAREVRAERALERFCLILATFAADATLIAGARGGVILGGGILPRIEGPLRASGFIERFTARGPMREYMEAIPVDLLVDPDSSLRGAALS